MANGLSVSLYAGRQPSPRHNASGWPQTAGFWISYYRTDAAAGVNPPGLRVSTTCHSRQIGSRVLS